MREPLTLPRRKFLSGGLALLAAPAIVRASSLMQIKPESPPFITGWDLASGPDRLDLLVNPPLTRNVTLTISGETVWMENIDLGPGKVHFIGYDMKAGRWVSVQSIPERQPGA